MCGGQYHYVNGVLQTYTEDGLAGGLLTSTNCADSRQLEEMLTVLYTASDAEPVFDTSDPADFFVRLKNVAKWKLVDTVPWKLLKRTAAESDGVRLVDLGMFNDLDSVDGLKLWFRFQGNSSDDLIKFEYIRVYGVSRSEP